MKRSRFTEQQIAYALERRLRYSHLAADLVGRRPQVLLRFSSGRRGIRDSGRPSCAGCGKWRRRTRSSRSWSPASAWTRRCCRTWFVENFEAATQARTGGCLRTRYGASPSRACAVMMISHSVYHYPVVGADPVCRLLTTAPGVGLLTAVAFRTAVDDPSRFRHIDDVGPFLGLTPRKYQSRRIGS